MVPEVGRLAKWRHIVMLTQMDMDNVAIMIQTTTLAAVRLNSTMCQTQHVWDGCVCLWNQVGLFTDGLSW